MKETLGIDAGAGDATPRAILYEARIPAVVHWIDRTLLNLDVQTSDNVERSKFRSRNAKPRVNDVITVTNYFSCYLTPPVLSDVMEPVHYLREIRCLI